LFFFETSAHPDDFELRCNFLNILRLFGHTTHLQDEVYDNLLKDFPDNVEVLSFVAQRPVHEFIFLTKFKSFKKSKKNDQQVSDNNTVITFQTEEDTISEECRLLHSMAMNTVGYRSVVEKTMDNFDTLVKVGFCLNFYLSYFLSFFRFSLSLSRFLTHSLFVLLFSTPQKYPTSRMWFQYLKWATMTLSLQLPTLVKLFFLVSERNSLTHLFHFRLKIVTDSSFRTTLSNIFFIDFILFRPFFSQRRDASSLASVSKSCLSTSTTSSKRIYFISNTSSASSNCCEIVSKECKNSGSVFENNL
jgi:hypothetical protein